MQNAIDKMAPALRFYRHQDGGLSQFNGSQEEKEERHQQREDRRREMEFVPKARFEGWDQERVDDL